ncbi:MAG: hypothetical protein AYP45_11665 [Candidatus Brocadia carolinensis]|uniref:Uncharacterized protein n=1 Tax=Candidatus Brocadia carolinensis TaxID=1004156 RepID=A0A1V4AS33_9BACT|nr:MAG: hypothetical protein AYP45_11665 [Candidatus Brocadia caroliniensis]
MVRATSNINASNYRGKKIENKLTVSKRFKYTIFMNHEGTRKSTANRAYPYRFTMSRFYKWREDREWFLLKNDKTQLKKNTSFFQVFPGNNKETKRSVLSFIRELLL